MIGSKSPLGSIAASPGQGHIKRRLSRKETNPIQASRLWNLNFVSRKRFYSPYTYPISIGRARCKFIAPVYSHFLPAEIKLEDSGKLSEYNGNVLFLFRCKK